MSPRLDIWSPFIKLVSWQTALPHLQVGSACRVWNEMEFKGNICNDGVQDMLPQSMAPWHTDIVNWRNLRKRKKKVFLSFPCPSPLKWVLDPHVTGALSIPQGEEHPHSKREGHRGSEQTGLAKCLWVYYP